MKRALLALLLVSALALAAGATPPTPGLLAEAGPGEAGHVHGTQEGGHEHGTEAGDHQHEGREVDHEHLPIQLYYHEAFFMAPWRTEGAERTVAAQAGVVILLDAALLAWLWWRRR